MEGAKRAGLKTLVSILMSPEEKMERKLKASWSDEISDPLASSLNVPAANQPKREEPWPGRRKKRLW